MVNLKPILFMASVVLRALALFMIAPLVLAIYTDGHGVPEFFKSIIITTIASGLFWHKGRSKEFKLGIREMFLLTTCVWIIASAFAALPLMLIQHISYTDAYFETMSGITTTGSTVLSNLDTTAHSVLLWRSILQWLGGVGFVVMGVAVLPYLNVGGMRLFQTESSDWSDKNTTKTQHTAAYVMYVYLSLTVLCYFGYLSAGMTSFEAVNHAMTTLSTGGYSTSDQSMAHFTNAAQWNGTFFMFLGGLPFLLLITAIHRRNIKVLLKDAQIIGFAKLVLIMTLTMSIYLWQKDVFSLSDAIRISVFNIVSVVTTTGFGLTDFGTWGEFTTVLFAGLMFTGACSGSTSGGIKIFRFQIAFTLFRKQMSQLVHPSGVFRQHYNGRNVNDVIVRSVVAFGSAFIATIAILAAILSLLGLDPITSITGAITAVANVGPGLGPVIGPSGNFASLPDSAKWALSLGMLMGRLEIMTVLVLVTPAFWKG